MSRLWPLLLFVAALWSGGTLRAAPPPSPLPVTTADPTWGKADAPVTVIGFSDLECPFCERVLNALHALRKDYGETKIRIVHKHFPLGFHKQAHRAAQVGAALQTLEGSDAFFEYQDAIFAALKNGDAPLDVVDQLGFDAAPVKKLLDGGTPKKKVDEDIALGKKAGVRGTPAFFINGVFLSGAQPKTKFAGLIDEQLAKAAALRKRGVPAKAISERLTRENYAARAGKPGSTVWKVPVGKSPTLGSKSALVTLVMFTDFQCPYCARLMPTVANLRAKYGKDLRVVFKHHPLSFHKRADAAAQLAIEAHARRGEGAFWDAAEKLFASHRNLDDATLEAIAKELLLNPKTTMAAIASRKHDERIERDQLLAKDVGASGTPSSYINGRKISGAGNQARFEQFIDEELDKAKRLVKQGIPRSRVYAHIMKSAKGPAPPPKMSVPKLDKATPLSRKWARLTIQVFVDFESGFWLRAVPAMRRLEKTYGSKLRFAFRHKPMAFHKKARWVHAAAQEAFAQKGSKGFWAFYDRIVDDPHVLDRETLLEHAAAIGMNRKQLETAWEDKRHDARIDADVKLADDRNITSVPAFLIGPYFVSGAKSYLELERVVDLALK